MRGDPGLIGSALCRALAEATDEWLCRLFDAALADAALGGACADGVALVAVGGYGRGELCPASDVDVMLLDGSRRRDKPDLRRLAERIWYPVWDSGTKLGHAVRTVKEALALASSNLDTATALLDTRLVAGDANVAADLAVRAADQWRSRSSRWLAELSRSVSARHERRGEVAFLLEPDLKEGRGGLRDVHALRWAEAAQRILLDEDQHSLDGAYETILAARAELQRGASRVTDVLLLQEQDRVAAALGDADADMLMSRIAAAARTIAWTSDEAWRRIDASLQGPRGRSAVRDQQIGRSLILREEVVELEPGADPSQDPALVLRAAAAAATAGTRLGRRALDQLAARGGLLPEPWPEEARRALLRLLGAGADAIPVLEALDQKGLLVRLVPEWAAVRSQPQRNAYHRFTVDRHLCEAAAQAAALAARVERPDLLVIGAWLHDLGKGHAPLVPSGDHSEAGAVLAERIGARLGFDSHDVAVLVTLVRHHLLLADAATRRDVQDPATVSAVAEAVGDLGTLHLLHALTEADSIATGPAAWSPWKAGLVADLVGRVAKVLRGEAHPGAGEDFPGPDDQAVIDQARATGELVVQGDGMSVVLAAPDRPGLFNRVAGTLALHALDVLSARATSGGGVAVERFRVDPIFGGTPHWPAVEEDLRRVLAGRLSLEARLAERARAYAGRVRFGMASATPARTQVTLDNEASEAATVVEVRAPDRMGTLYRITRALADLELNILHAKVISLGHEVVDAFYVVDPAGRKLTDPDHRREVEQAVLVELSRL